jgi:hypothetical protein
LLNLSKGGKRETKTTGKGRKKELSHMTVVENEIQNNQDHNKRILSKSIEWILLKLRTLIYFSIFKILMLLQIFLPKTL